MHQIDEEDEHYTSDQERYIEKATSDRDECKEETTEEASGEEEAEVDGNEQSVSTVRKVFVRQL